MDPKNMELCEDVGTMDQKPAHDSSSLDGINDDSDGDIDKDEGEGNDWEESDMSSREEGQEWEVDSFDDEVYLKPKEGVPPKDECRAKLYRYRQQLYRSRGFNVDKDCYSGNIFCRQLHPICLDDKPFSSTVLNCQEYIQSMVDLSLDKYNHIKGSNVICESIVRVIRSMTSGYKCYITFMARETPDGDLVEYQAKTEKRIWQKNHHVIFCRPSPEPKEPPPDDECVCAGTSSGEDSDASSRDSDQEWGVDSMDDESDYRPPHQLAPSEEEIQKIRLYRPLMYKSKGFHVDGESYPGKTVYFSQVALDEFFRRTKSTGREYMERIVKLALDKYNEIKNSNVTCESIVRAILTRITGLKLYITFMAIESPGEDPVEYQAKTEQRVWQRKAHVIFCRPTPKSEVL